MALKDIISNQELKDDAEIMIGDQKMKVGDLRAEFSSPPSGYVPQTEYDRLAQQHGQLTGTLTSFLNSATAAADKTDGAPPPQDPREVLKSALTELLGDKGYDYDKDQYVGPAMKTAAERARKEALEEAESRFNPKLSALETAQKTALERQALVEEKAWYRSNRDQIPTNSQTGKPYTSVELRKIALHNKVVDEQGWPDYDALLDRMTAPKRQQDAIQAAREEGRMAGIREARDAARNNLIGLPGGRSAGVGDGGKPPIDTEGKSPRQILDEALNSALGDPDILKLQEAY